ncbi:hypothetical protein L6164_012850 [Bauhinia variegata]|uniref:Uncharacterized protein n=1 Tax=Bauhinia variegata TaxID=167791 RepID=A0ACB9PCK0_BAUVA|nr:hypothetical protein L6164_012850 [Bauhinia variegata]
MGSFPKQPFICLKWPWDAQQSNKTLSPCGFESPWLFKSFQNLGAFAFSFLNSAMKPQTADFNSSNPLQLDEKTGQKKNLIFTRKSLTPSEQGEAEHRAFASALASGKEATVIEFYSPKCGLCNSLLNFVSEVETRNSDWLNIVMADAENEKWLPEVSYFQFKICSLL